MTDNEIIKALEDKTHKAEYSWVDSSYCDVEVSLLKNALALINRQQAENDNWEKQFRILDVECSRLEKKTEKQQAEIERLKNANDSFTDIGKLYSEIKSEAIKEFAERLKKEFTTGSAIMRISVLNIVDDLVKEMIGENK